jgi:hypothetical protein
VGIPISITKTVSPNENSRRLLNGKKAENKSRKYAGCVSRKLSFLEKIMKKRGVKKKVARPGTFVGKKRLPRIKR